jgi:hypothetical protein
VPTFTLALVVRFDAVRDDAAVDALGAALRVRDEDLLIWRDADPAVVRLSLDRSAEDADAAVLRGLESGDDAIGLSRCTGIVEEVVAMDDDRQVVWRREP